MILRVVITALRVGVDNLLSGSGKPGILDAESLLQCLPAGRERGAIFFI